MRVIVVDNPFVAMMLEMLFTGKPVGGEGGGGTPLRTTINGQFPVRNDVPDLKANPDFYTKPEVPKVLVLKVRSNTIPDKFYNVTRDRHDALYCTCTGFKYRGKCSHIAKVQKAVASGTHTGLGMCLHCSLFSRDEADINTPGRKACKSIYTLACPPSGRCKYFYDIVQGSTRYTVGTPPKEMPMTFKIEGALLQTFQSRHFPEVQYEVKLKDGDLVCSCRGFQFHGTCKHVQYMKQRVNQGTIRI